MSTAGEVLADIGKAADELGYRVTLLEPDRVVLEPAKDSILSRYSVSIEGARYYGRVIVDGEGIRKVLRNLNPIECKCGCCR